MMDMNRLIAHCDTSAVSELRRVVEERAFPVSDLLPFSAVQILAPIPRPQRNVFCVGDLFVKCIHTQCLPFPSLLGKNYLDHINEVQAVLDGGNDDASRSKAAAVVPKHAYFFTKAPQCVIAHLDHVDSHPTITQVW